VRRRIWFALTAVAAASIAISAGMAGAAGATTGSAAAANAFKMHCKMSLATVPPKDSNVVDQPSEQGSQYGPVHCGQPLLFGGGIAADRFTVPDNGDIVGTFTQYFKSGSVSGRFDLSPQEADFSATNFEGQSWEGPVKVVRGTGLYKGIKGKRAGTLSCTSDDSVHLSCVEKVKLKQL
jgi:hypothetical protein